MNRVFFHVVFCNILSLPVQYSGKTISFYGYERPELEILKEDTDVTTKHILDT